MVLSTSSGIEGDKQASTCYSWSSTIEGSDKKRFYAVLKIPPKLRSAQLSLLIINPVGQHNNLSTAN